MIHLSKEEWIQPGNACFFPLAGEGAWDYSLIHHSSFVWCNSSSKMTLSLDINSNCPDRHNSPASRTQTIPPLSPCQSCLPSASHRRCALDSGLSRRRGLKCLGTPNDFSWAQTLTFADRMGQRWQGWARHSTVLHNISTNQFVSLVDTLPGPSWIIGHRKEAQAHSCSPRRLEDWP